MTPETFKSIRNRAGLSTRQTAQALRISDSSNVRKWERGQIAISGPVSILKELLDAGIWQPERARKAKGE